MTDRASSDTTIGMLGPIELAEFRDYLSPDALKASPPRGLGGTPVNLLCKELLDRGRRLVVFSLDRSIETERIFEGKRLRIYLGPYTNRARNFFSQERQFLGCAIRREKVALLHAHFTCEFALAAIDSGLPHVVTAHDAPINCFRHMLVVPKPRTFMSYYRATRGVVYWTIRTLMAYKSARSSQRLVAVSPYVAEHLRRYGFRGKPIELIPNGVPDAYFENTSGRKPGRAFTFATILSGWAGLKNGGAAIEAFAKIRRTLPDARMLMFGEGHSADGPAAAWARERGWDGGIEFRGLVSHADVIDLLSWEVDALVHPSLEEAHPMPLVEAMSLGIPVIAGSGVGGVPWTLGDGRYGMLVDVCSPDHIASAMHQLAQDHEVRTRFAATARAFAKSQFRIGQVADKYEAIYAQLAAQAFGGAYR